MKYLFSVVVLFLFFVQMSFGQKFHDAVVENLHGTVKMVSYINNGGNETITFSEDGRMFKKNWTNFSHDKNGYLIKCETILFGRKGITTYTYNQYGQIVEEVLKIGNGTCTVLYEYNIDGTVKKEIQKLRNDIINLTMEISYSYVDFDKHGNWVFRRVRIGEMSNIEEWRTIVYW